MAAAIIRFPEAGAEIPVTVKFEVRNNKEVWQRTFAGRSFSSVQSEGRGLSDKLLCERFGLLSFGMALVIRDDRLNLVVRHWSCLGIPLPFFLAPRGDAYEHAEDGRFNFHVEIGHPFAGLIVRYHGWMVPNAYDQQPDRPHVYRRAGGSGRLVGGDSRFQDPGDLSAGMTRCRRSSVRRCATNAVTEGAVTPSAVVCQSSSVPGAGAQGGRAISRYSANPSM